MKFFLTMVFILGEISLASLTLHADVFIGPISSALGGTGRAGIDGTEGAFLNPALVPLLRTYEVDAYYSDGSLNPLQHHIAAGLGAGDNGPNVLFPAELHYMLVRNTGLALTPANGELWHVATGFMIGEQVSLGLTVYRLTYTGVGLPTTIQWNYNLGSLWMITRDIGVAYVLNNIANPGSDVPQGLRQDLQQGVGFLASVFEVARARLDITRNETNNAEQKMVYMAGFESLTGKHFIFRLGFQRDDQVAQNYATAGLCYNGPRLKLDYSFQKDLQGASGALHSVDIRVPF